MTKIKYRSQRESIEAVLMKALFEFKNKTSCRNYACLESAMKALQEIDNASTCDTGIDQEMEHIEKAKNFLMAASFGNI